jgi:TolB-like protein
VCYAHEDSDAVHREIAWLNDYGVNVWYDEGISPGHEWREELANAIQGCARVLYFVTPNSVVSEHCRRELNFAQEENREVVAIHLEPTEVPAGLRLGLNNRQAIHKHDLSDDEYRKRLMRVTHEGTSAPSQASDQPAPAVSRRGIGIAVLVVVLLAVAVAVWQLTPQNVPAGNSVAEPVAETAAGASSDVLHNSIAVLPFDNLSPNPDDAYFAAGIHEEVLNRLANVKDLSVIARTTVLRYADSGMSIPEIGRELRVATVMEGSVRYAGNRVRITAQLIDAESGAHLWSQAYEENLEDIFGIQSAIATRIADTLEAELSPAERERIATRGTSNSEAYALYLRAINAWGDFNAPEPILEMLDSAIELDPNFASALAFRAWITTTTHPRLVGPQFDAVEQRRRLELGESYASRALAIDDTQARAYLALNPPNSLKGRWDNSFQNVVLAYNLNPNDYTTVMIMGVFTAMNGDAEAGLRYFERGLELNPADRANVWFMGEISYQVQRWQTAREYAQLVVSVTPEFAWGYALLAKIDARLGDALSVRRNAELAEAKNPTPYDLLDLAQAYHVIGDTNAAKRIFRIAKAGDLATMADPNWQLRMHIAIGEHDRALDYLEQLIEEKFPLVAAATLYYQPDHPDFDSIRSSPRFRDAITRLRNEGPKARI